MPSTNHIIQFYHGNRFTELDLSVYNLSPTTTVLKYLRETLHETGTKEGCAEGDCGACTVVIAESDELNQLHFNAVNSCLMFLPQLHGKQLITIENIGNEHDLHPVQKAIVENNASQCGFCTPGFVMSLYALYKTPDELDDESIKAATAGNLCRCTGYKSILTAARQALSGKSTDFFSEHERSVASKLNAILENRLPLYIENSGNKYFVAKTLDDALEFIKNNPEATIVSGSTDIALKVTKKHERIPVILDISYINELKQINATSKSIYIGSGVNIENVRRSCNTAFPALSEMLKVFGSQQIRHKATLGGNIGSASPIGDTLPVLMAYDASVILISKQGERKIPIRSFITSYRTTLTLPGELIKGVEINILSPDIKVNAYKISKRRQVDISTLSAAFRHYIDSNNIIKEFDVWYGGMAAVPKHASLTCEFLRGKLLTPELVKAAMEKIAGDFVPISDARASSTGRLIMAKNLLMKFFNEILNQNK